MYKCKVAKTSAIWQQPGHTTYQLLSPSCSTRGLHALKPTCKGKILETFMGTCQENGPLAEKTPLSRKSNSTGRKKERGEGKEIEDVPWDCRQGGDNRHLRPAFLLSRLLSGKRAERGWCEAKCHEKDQCESSSTVDISDCSGWEILCHSFLTANQLLIVLGVEMDGWSLQQRIPWHFQTIDLRESGMNLCHFHGWIGISVLCLGLVRFFGFLSLFHDHCPKLCFYKLLGLFVDLDWLGWS